MLAGFLISAFSVGCCFIPVALASIGLGSAWGSRLEFLEKFRPLLVLLSLASLGWGFFRYRQSARNSSCSLTEGSSGTRGMKAGFFWIIVIGSLIVLGLSFLDRDSH